MSGPAAAEQVTVVVPIENSDPEDGSHVLFATSFPPIEAKGKTTLTSCAMLRTRSISVEQTSDEEKPGPSRVTSAEGAVGTDSLHAEETKTTTNEHNTSARRNRPMNSFKETIASTKHSSNKCRDLPNKAQSVIESEHYKNNWSSKVMSFSLNFFFTSVLGPS